MSRIVDEHRQYLADQPRVSAFHQAIRAVVQPGAVVLDLGAGTGILGLFACQAGAGRVYAIDEGGIIELARHLCHTNGFHDRIVFIKGLSTRVELPEKVDVVVADQIGRFGFDAGIVEYFSDARQRFLKPDGVLVPSRIDMWVAPLEYAEACEWLEFWKASPQGFDFHAAHVIATNTGYPVHLRPEHLLGDPVLSCSIDLSMASGEPLRFKATMAAQRAGTLHGVGGWFSAALAAGVTMSNSPLAPHPINRRNVFFPIASPVAVAQGDRVEVTMHIVPNTLMVTWKVAVWETPDKHHGDQGSVRKASFTHSTFQGMLLCKEDMESTQPQFVPRLSPWGQARLSVLSLCDGHRPLAEIEREVHRRHSQLFPSLGHAAEFVAEVITRYTARPYDTHKV